MLNESDHDETATKTKTCPNGNCNFDLHVKGANFCILCGTLLYQRCDDCLEVNPKYARFCYCCGTSIEDLRNFSSRFEQEEETDSEE